MIQNNAIKVSKRLYELLIDYLVILAYLLLLLVIFLGIYFGIIGNIPEFTMSQSQWIATLSSVVPLTILFTYFDYKGGTLGKKKAKLQLEYKNSALKSSVLRNIFKLLPWQLAHMGVIDGIYTDYTTLSSIVLSFVSIVLFVIMLLMGLYRKDKRHLADMIAGTQVVRNYNELL